MDAEQWDGMVFQAHAGAQTTLEKISDRDSPVLLAGDKGKIQEAVNK